jgi:hypothetical protein
MRGLSNDTTFNPPFFSLANTFKDQVRRFFAWFKNPKHQDSTAYSMRRTDAACVHRTLHGAVYI